MALATFARRYMDHVRNTRGEEHECCVFGLLFG